MFLLGDKVECVLMNCWLHANHYEGVSGARTEETKLMYLIQHMFFIMKPGSSIR